MGAGISATILFNEEVVNQFNLPYVPVLQHYSNSCANTQAGSYQFAIEAIKEGFQTARDTIDFYCLSSSPDFIAYPVFGYGTQNVNFTYLSSLEPDSIKWDFDNDGIFDSFERNPIWTYHEYGVYTVSATVFDGIYSESEIKEDYIEILDPAIGLIANYPFTNGSTEDMTGNGNDGIIVGDSITVDDRFGSLDDAYYFDGEGDFIEISNSTFFQAGLGKTLSWSFWIKPETYNNIVMYKGGYGTQGSFFDWCIEITNDGSIGFRYPNSSRTRQNNYHSSQIVELNEWNYIAVKYKFGTGSSIEIYQNGILTNGVWVEHSGNDLPYVSDEKVYLAKRHNYDGNYDQYDYYVGILDDVKIYNRAISLSEVQYQYLEGEWGLIAEFKANVLEGPPPLTVQFNDMTLGVPNSWLWDFNGDGAIDSDLQNPIFTFEEEGTYNAKLIVGNEYVTDSMFKQDYISSFYTLPEVSTTLASEIARNYAKIGGDIIFSGGLEIISRGICWNTQGNPSLDDNVITDTLFDVGQYQFYLFPLNCETDYYFRAFATNAIGTSFGEIKQFSTMNCLDTYFQPLWSIDNLQMDINVFSATYNWDSLVNGNEIGVFDVDENGSQYCVGMIQINDEISDSMHIVCSANNPNIPFQPNGFVDGHPFIFKYLTQEYGEIEQVSYTFPLNITDKLFTNNGSSTVILDGNQGTHIDTLILTDGWNQVSSYVLPREQLIDQLFDQTIIVQNLNGFYWPSGNIDSLVCYEYNSGYQIKINGTTEIILEGIIPQNKTIHLNEGWNLVPVLMKSDIGIEELFGSNLNKVGLIKDAVGMKVYWPEHNIFSLTEMKSGNSYLIYITESIDVMFPFEDIFVCGGLLLDLRDGEKYKTVQMGENCWMAENLNVGTMINGVQNQSDNGIIEKYCYNDDEAKCDLYGGLYQWDEVMDYWYDNGIQGICPDGWHFPSDEEWKVLEGYADSIYSIGHPIWGNNGWRGYDVGNNLKSNYGWHTGMNGSDLHGFLILPAGARDEGGAFSGEHIFSYFWTTYKPHISKAVFREFQFYSYQSLRDRHSIHVGNSVRCIKDQ